MADLRAAGDPVLYPHSTLAKYPCTKVGKGVIDIGPFIGVTHAYMRADTIPTESVAPSSEMATERDLSSKPFSRVTLGSSDARGSAMTLFDTRTCPRVSFLPSTGHSNNALGAHHDPPA